MSDEEGPRQPAWEGQWDEEGRPHGQGTMSYPPPPAGEDEEEKPGDKFVGTMVHGKREGNGRYTWSSGATFDGVYVNNVKCGSGVMVFPDKGRYEGQWEADKMHGEGVYTYANGDTYQGSFEAGLKHGRGTYHCKAQSCQLIGVWDKGNFSKGTWVHHDGSQFQGNFQQSVPADGTFYFARSGLSQGGQYKAGCSWKGADVVLAAPPAGTCS